MNKIIFPLFALIIVSCGDSQPTQKTQEEVSTDLTATELRDSAIVISFDAETMAEKEQAVALYNQSIELDPDNRQSHMGKLGIISQMGDDQMLLSAIEDSHEQFPTDPFITLHLGMEYELQKSMEKAQPLYDQSLDTFVKTLDTMTTSSSLVRNSFLMNMAMANVLTAEKKDISEIAKILDPAEIKNYETATTQFEAMDRNALLNLRRN